MNVTRWQQRIECMGHGCRDHTERLVKSSNAVSDSHARRVPGLGWKNVSLLLGLIVLASGPVHAQLSAPQLSTPDGLQWDGTRVAPPPQYRQSITTLNNVPRRRTYSYQATDPNTGLPTTEFDLEGFATDAGNKMFVGIGQVVPLMLKLAAFMATVGLVLWVLRSFFNR